jgi:hypothetical protein
VRQHEIINKAHVFCVVSTKSPAPFPVRGQYDTNKN